jgi:hypothetical protein
LVSHPKARTYFEVFEERMLRSVFGPKREEGRTLLHEELHNLYSPPNIIKVTRSRRMRCAGMRNMYKILVRKLEGNRF